MAMKVKAEEHWDRYLFHSDLNPKVYIAIFCISCQTGQNFFSVAKYKTFPKRPRKKRKSSDFRLIQLLVGVPGLEPGKAGPESAVLPLHHTPN